MRTYDEEALRHAYLAEEELSVCELTMLGEPTPANVATLNYSATRASVHAGLAVAFSRIGKS